MGRERKVQFPEITVTPTKEQRALAFLKNFVATNQRVIEDDSPINGSDAVDYLVELYGLAKKICKS